MEKKRKSLYAVGKWLAAFCLAAGLVMGIRHYWIESYRISTEAMLEALYPGDYILVDKWQRRNDQVRNRVVLFTSPLLRDTATGPLFISRCIGMPGDTIRVGPEGYTVNGRTVPRSPRALTAYFVALKAKEDFLRALHKLQIPEREMKVEPFGLSLRLTSFEAYQIREELPEALRSQLINDPGENYTLIVPRKGWAHRLDAAALTACKEAILRETGGKARFREGKLYLDGRETSFFFFAQDYYWVLSDNTAEAVDSRHLGFIPADHLIGNAFFCWYSPDKGRIFKPVN